LAWLIKIHDAAEKDIAKLDRVVAKRIIRFLRERVMSLDDPRSIGEALKGSRLGEYWKYRVGDYRIICRIEDSQITVYIVRVGNRREIYR
jgi:mRNA interferase RelE/StbE